MTLLAFRRNMTKTTIPHGETAIEPGDELIILASDEHLEELSDFLSGGPLVDQIRKKTHI